jgi:protocatechuate 3,4-dioxygenase beta subunit
MCLAEFDRMYNSAFRVSLLFFSALMIRVPAQTPPSGAIAGIVLDAGSNSPLRRAVVTLSTVEAQPQDAVAWTDSNGRFSFGYLAPGRYMLRAMKNGYQRVNYGADSVRRPPAVIQLAAGELRNALIFRLVLMNSVTGVVLDEDGDPLANVQVTALVQGFERQRRRLLPGPGTMTDSTGRYRLSGLAPGRYAVSAAHVNGFVNRMHPEAAAGELQQQYSYGVQYYPGTDRAEAAALIAVQPGQEISSIDFRLVAQIGASIEGRIIVPEGAGSVKDMIINTMSRNVARSGINYGAGVSPQDYTFHTNLLAPGPYLLIAQASIDGRSCRGTQSVDLGPQGLRDVAVPMEATVDLAGSVSIEGPDAGRHTAAFVNLSPGDDIPWNGPPLRASVEKDGSFKIGNVPPGIWDIGVSPIPPAGYVKSMRLGDRDVLTEDMTIGPSTTQRLTIVLGTRAATLEGDVLHEDQPARAAVVLAPDGKFRHVLSFYRLVGADEKGRFEIRNTTPGEYRLYAFEELDPQSIQDPDFLKPFETSSVLVTLREGPNASQKLPLIPAGTSPAVLAPAPPTPSRPLGPRP